MKKLIIILLLTTTTAFAQLGISVKTGYESYSQIESDILIGSEIVYKLGNSQIVLSYSRYDNKHTINDGWLLYRRTIDYMKVGYYYKVNIIDFGLFAGAVIENHRGYGQNEYLCYGINIKTEIDLIDNLFLIIGARYTIIHTDIQDFNSVGLRVGLLYYLW